MNPLELHKKEGWCAGLTIAANLVFLQWNCFFGETSGDLLSRPLIQFHFQDNVVPGSSMVTPRAYTRAPLYLQIVLMYHVQRCSFYGKLVSVM